MNKTLSLLFIAISLFLASCGSSSENEEVSTVTAAVSQEPATLDVHRNSSQITRLLVVGNVLEKPVTLDSEGRAVPELCESFESENGAKSWIFQIKDGIVFHNGRGMDAGDVAISLNRWADNFSSVSSMLGGARFEVVDGMTVRIDCPESVPFLPEMMAFSSQSAAIYAKECFDTLDADGLVTEVIGTGPYRIESWEKGVSMTLERFDGYVEKGANQGGLSDDKKAPSEKIEYLFVPDAFARTAMCETGGADFMNDLMNDDIPRFENRDDLAVLRGEEAGSLVALFNKMDGLCSENWVRKAVNTALDLDVVMAACYGSGGYVMHHNYMEGQQALWTTEGPESRYDVGDKEAARAMLEDNGYDGTPLRVLSSNSSNMDKAALALCSELEKAGFETEVTIVDWAAMMALRSDPSAWDICITAMSQVPVPSLKLFLSPGYAGWSDDEHLAELMAELNTSPDLGCAEAKWAEIQDYCYDYLPAIVIGHYQSGYLASSKLEGVNTYSGFWLWNAEVRN